MQFLYRPFSNLLFSLTIFLSMYIAYYLVFLSFYSIAVKHSFKLHCYYYNVHCICICLPTLVQSNVYLHVSATLAIDKHTYSPACQLMMFVVLSIACNVINYWFSQSAKIPFLNNFCSSMFAFSRLEPTWYCWMWCWKYFC